MKIYFLIWISWGCPGGWFSGFVPENLRPFVCKAQSKQEPFDKLIRAQNKAVDVGQSSAPSICECKATRCSCEPVVWETKAKF